MAVSLPLLAGIFTLLAPVYAALWRIHKDIGGLNVETTVNDEDITSLSEGINAVDSRVSEVEDDIEWLKGRIEGQSG